MLDQQVITNKSIETSQQELTTITIAHGDGIGPEIMKATLNWVALELAKQV